MDVICAARAGALRGLSSYDILRMTAAVLQHDIIGANSSVEMNAPPPCNSSHPTEKKDIAPSSPPAPSSQNAPPSTHTPLPSNHMQAMEGGVQGCMDTNLCHTDSIKSFLDSYESPSHRQLEGVPGPSGVLNTGWTKTGGVSHEEGHVQARKSKRVSHGRGNGHVHGQWSSLHGTGRSPDNGIAQRVSESKASIHAISVDYGSPSGETVETVLRDPAEGSWIGAFGSLLWGTEGPSPSVHLPSHVTGGVYDKAPSGMHR